MNLDRNEIKELIELKLTDVAKKHNKDLQDFDIYSEVVLDSGKSYFDKMVGKAWIKDKGNVELRIGSKLYHMFPSGSDKQKNEMNNLP